jgi:hypothetical protein
MATHAWDTMNKEKDRSAFDELTEIAHRVQTFANASALTIGLRVGNTDEIVCCARSGPKAEDVGAIMGIAGPFSRLSIQSGKGLLCEDTETDLRVDLVAVRALGIRSIVVTPVKEDNRVVAVLAVFAPFANAFTGIHLAVMKTAAEQIAAFLQKTHSTPEEEYEPAPALAPVAVPKASTAVEPMVPPAAAVQPITVEPAPAAAPMNAVSLAVKPVAVTRVAESPAPVIAASELSTPVRETPPRALENSKAFGSGAAPAFRIQPVTVVLAEDVKPVVVAVKATAPLPPREERMAKPKQNRDIFSTLNAQAVQHKKSRSKLIVAGAVAFAVVTAGAALAFVKSRHAVPPPVAQHVQEAPAPVQVAAATVGSTSNSESSPAPAITVGPAANNALAKPPVAASTAPLANNAAPTSGATNSSADSAGKLSKTEVKTSTAQPGKPAPETVTLASGPSKITQAGTADSGQQDTAAPPALTVGGNAALGKLSALSGPGASAKPSVTTQSTMEPAVVIKKVSPVLPSFLRNRGIANAEVVISARIGTDGRASNLQFIGGQPTLRDAAFDAIKQWQFKPAKLNGQPIEQNQEIRIKFQ